MASAPAARTAFEFPHAWAILEDIGVGEQTCRGGAKMARGAAHLAEGASRAGDLRELGKLASSAKDAEGKHAERGLHRWASRQPWRRLLPEIYEYQATKWCGVRKGLRVRSQAVLLPHEVVGALGAAGPEMVARILGPPYSWSKEPVPGPPAVPGSMASALRGASAIPGGELASAIPAGVPPGSMASALPSGGSGEMASAIPGGDAASAVPGGGELASAMPGGGPPASVASAIPGGAGELASAIPRGAPGSVASAIPGGASRGEVASAIPAS